MRPDFYRGRKRSFVASGGTNWNPNFPENATPTEWIYYDSYSEDWVGAGDNWRFHVNRFEKSGGLLNRDWPVGNSIQFKDYVSDVQRGFDPGVHGHWSIPTPSDGEYVVQLMKRTNPSRPYVDLAQFIGELKDIPGLIQTTGRGLLRFLGGNNLRYSFGIAPLIQDLVKMLDFQSQVDNRIKEIERLYTKGLRRSITLDRLSKTGSYWQLMQSYGAFVGAEWTWNTSLTVRGHIRWKPTTATPPTQDEMRLLAHRAVKGIYLSPATAWELFPWSWLIDWCTNLGDYLAAQRNLIEAEVDNASITRVTTTSAVSQEVWDEERRLSISPVLNIYQTKDRRRAQPSLAAHFPFLTMKQMGILASIGVTRGR